MLENVTPVAPASTVNVAPSFMFVYSIFETLPEALLLNFPQLFLSPGAPIIVPLVREKSACIVPSQPSISKAWSPEINIPKKLFIVPL